MSTDEQFPDRNLDHLRARVASGRPTQEPAREDLLALIEHGLASGRGSVTIVLNEADTWTVSIRPNRLDCFVNEGPRLHPTLQGAVEKAGWVPRERPHVAAQEDDGETD